MAEESTSKIRIKMGSIEVEYEGSASFLKKELPDLLAAVSKLYHESGQKDGETAESGSSGGKTNLVHGTTGSFAAKLKVASGPDLILAAAAHLTLSKGKDVFSRKELTAAMQSATAYHKTTYVNNLSKYLKTLMKEDKLREPSTGNFSLSAEQRKKLEGQLAK